MSSRNTRQPGAILVADERELRNDAGRDQPGRVLLGAVLGVDPSWPGQARALRRGLFFGTKPDLAHEITPLVLDGTKTATGSLLWAAEADGKAPPRPGDFWIVTNGGDDPQCVIETFEARVIPFDEVGEEYARGGARATVASPAGARCTGAT